LYFSCSLEFIFIGELQFNIVAERKIMNLPLAFIRVHIWLLVKLLYIILSCVLYRPGCCVQWLRW